MSTFDWGSSDEGERPTAPARKRTLFRRVHKRSGSRQAER